MDLTGWLPIYAYQAAGELMLDWCFIGTRRFTEPFFADTIDRLMADPAVLLFRHQTTIAQAWEWLGANPGLEPTGFIFHMSRCGSTLVSQMLAAAPANRVLSEPPAIHGVLQTGRADWLRTVVGLLSIPAPGESRCFIKFDCWQVLDLPLIVQAFPKTPWIFLYRNPAEVMVSQMRTPSAWTLATVLDPEIFGLRMEDARALPRHEYCAHALAWICSAALEHRSLGRGRLVNYDELPEIVCRELPRHFGFGCEPEERDLMRQVAGFDAKTPQMQHTDDREAKRRAITPEIQSSVDRRLGPLFELLESQRAAQI